MRVFETHKGNKVNFVDDNNVLVGYDLTQNCCEDAGWFIRDSVMDSIPIEEQKISLNNYIFSGKYYEFFGEVEEFELCWMIIFGLVNPEDEKVYLHLYNCHNGYYTHGFEAKIGKMNWLEGEI